MVNLNQIAASAYGATQKLPSLGGEATATAGNASFADLLEQGVESFLDSQSQAEKLSNDAAMGKADINDVILAVQNADVALQGVVAIRDKVIQAYQDILRMAI
jgi:flagellar hook-basal body complex protein FliE